MDAVYIISASGEKTLLCSTADEQCTMTYHKLDLALNQAGSMKVDIPITNSKLSEINFLSDEITFERNGVEIFRGEADGNEKDILNTGEVRVTGALGYLSKLYMEPYEYQGPVEGYVKLLLDSYNSRALPNRQIQVGSVTVTDPNNNIVRSNTDRVNFLKLLQEKLVGKLGGYLRIRVSTDGTKYLDYLASFERTAAQSIEYGKNILDIAQDIEYQNVYTVIIPEGAEDEETGEKLTVASVNDGSVYVVDQEAVEKYGWREIVVEWEDVTLPENLLQKAKETLPKYTNPIKTVEVKAVDLALCSDVDCFYIGDMIYCESSSHEINDDYLLSEMTIYALSPEKERLTLGAAKITYSEATNNRLSEIEEKINTTKKDNWNLARKIKDADGLYTTKEEDPENEGAEKIWLHDKPNLNDSQLQISFSTAGILLTGDGGASWYGIEMHGDVIVRLLQAVGISAEIIEGGLQVSLAEDEDGNPVSWINWDKGTFSFANGAFVFDGQTFKIEQVTKIEGQITELKEQADATDQAVSELITMVEGVDGTYFYIRYSAYEDGHDMTIEPTDDTLYMGTCSTNVETAPTDYTAYTWCRVKGEDGTNGTPGVDGKDGKSQYFHVKYSDDGETFTSNSGETLGDWMGTCINEIEADPTDFNAYEWHKIVGEAGIPGEDGIPGKDGKDGVSTYFHVKYSNVENPTTADQMTEVPSKYIGTYVDYIEADSNNPSDYQWMKFQGSDGIDGKDGEQGIPGENGADGQTYYLHIKYSNDGGQTFTDNNGEDSGDWIGVYTDTIEMDSSDVTKYTWSKIKGEQGPKGNKGEDGTSVTIKGSVDSISSLPASGNTAGDGYIINGDLYVWDGEKWNNVGAIQGPAGDSAYMHIKYSDDGGKTFTANNGETSGKYVGVYADNVEADSNDPSKYTWTKIEGEDGVTYYTWIKYADTPTSGMSDSPEGKVYMGLAYNKTTPTESTNYSDYTWSLIKGEDGSDGVNGIDGIDGVTYYTWVKYADDANGKNMTDDPTDKYYIGLAYNKMTPDESSNAADYTWSLFRGSDGVDGKDGADGISQYFYVRYSANSNGNPMTSAPDSDTKYMGVCSTTSPTAPTSYSSYTWTQCRGNDGANGTPGPAGEDGRTQYLHIKYSDDGKTFTGNLASTNRDMWQAGYYASGSTIETENPNSGTTAFNRLCMTDVFPVNQGEKYALKSGYSSNLIKMGYTSYNTDGTYKTSTTGTSQDYTYTVPSGVGYMRIFLYCNDTSIVESLDSWEELFADGTVVPEFYDTTKIQGEELGAWIGTLVDFVETDSDIFSDYTWKKFTDDVDAELEEIRQTIVEQNTTLVSTCEEIVLSATENYVEKGTFDEFRESTESQLSVMSDNIEMNFSQATESIETVDGDLQSTKEEWSKYFRFTVNGMEIGSEGNALTLTLDNDMIAFQKNGETIAYWDGDTLRTGSLHVDVNESAQFGNFAFVPRSDGSLMLLKVGDS